VRLVLIAQDHAALCRGVHRRDVLLHRVDVVLQPGGDHRARSPTRSPASVALTSLGPRRAEALCERRRAIADQQHVRRALHGPASDRDRVRDMLDRGHRAAVAVILTA
jgi:hypothetical protein